MVGLFSAACSDTFDEPTKAKITADIASLFLKEGNRVLDVEITSISTKNRPGGQPLTAIARVEALVTLEQPVQLSLAPSRGQVEHKRVHLKLQYNKQPDGWTLLGETSPRRAAGGTR